MAREWLSPLTSGADISDAYSESENVFRKAETMLPGANMDVHVHKDIEHRQKKSNFLLVNKSDTRIYFFLFITKLFQQFQLDLMCFLIEIYKDVMSYETSRQDSY